MFVDWIAGVGFFVTDYMLFVSSNRKCQNTALGVIFYW